VPRKTEQIKEETVNGSGHGVDEGSGVRGGHVDLGAISSLVAELSKKDGAVRERARQQLVAIGAPSVTYLVEALENRNELLRWEAAKALGEIGNPAAAPALVAALEDEVFDVRWLAAEGLIALRGGGLVPLLSALVERPDSLWLREGAHHVLHDVSRGRLEEVLRPVVAALDDIEPSVEVPFAAKTVLKGLMEAEGGGGSGWGL
jgi:HEAT repeat protein